jgi:hypothetical protein
VYGKQVKPHPVDGDKLIDLQGKAFADKLKLGKSEPLRDDIEKSAELTILRNDEDYLVAAGQYNWTPGLNIEVRVIEKKLGTFWASLIHTSGKGTSDIYKGSCTIAMP